MMRLSGEMNDVLGTFNDMLGVHTPSGKPSLGRGGERGISQNQEKQVAISERCGGSQ